MKTTRHLFSRLLGAVGGALLALLALVLSLQGGAIAQGTGTDPEIRVLTVTANIPVSDTHSYQGVTKTVYFNNSGAGVLTLTVDLTGTPPLTLTAGAAFGETKREYTSTLSPATFVVTYGVQTTHGDQVGIPYTATNGTGDEVVITITYTQDTTSPTVAIGYPTSGAVLTRTLLPQISITGTASDATSGAAWVDVTTSTAWVSATGTTDWVYIWTLPTVDGEVYTLTARAWDHAGNWSTSANVTVTVDTVAPGATPPVPHKSPWVTSTVVYTWTPSIDGSDIRGYWVNITSTAGYTAFFWTVSSDLTFTGALQGVGYSARVQAVDGVGNVGAWSGPGTVVTPDLTAPTISNPQIVVGSGVTYFYVSGLTLFYTNTMPYPDSFTVKGNASDGGPSGLDSAAFSQAFGQTPFTDTDPVAFSGSYDVPPGATESGHITVTVYDRAGNTAIQVYTYTLDGDPPYTGAVTINEGAEYVTQTAVHLALFSADAGCGVARMCVSNGPSCSEWKDYATTIGHWSLADADGRKTVYVWFRDHLGNTSGPYTNTVVLDRQAPAGSITINNGAAYATQVTATLSLTATDATSGLADQPMRFSNDGTAWSTGEPFTTTKQWTLDGSTDGLKTVYVQYQDRAGNIATYSDTVFLDQHPPVVTVTAPLTAPVPFTVSWQGVDPGGSGVVSYSVAYSVTQWVLWLPSTALTRSTFYTATPGQTVVFSVTAYDRARNAGTGQARVYVDYHRVYIPLVLRNWVWWYQYDPYEPNDTPAQAYGPLSSSQVITAYIWDATDRDDYYWIRPAQNVTVTIALKNIPANCDWDLYVYYYQDGYKEVAHSDQTGNVDEQVSFSATANTSYYIRVYPFQGSSTQPYRLEVKWP